MLASIPTSLSAPDDAAHGDTVEIGIADPAPASPKAGQTVRRLNVSSLLASLPDDGEGASTLVVDPTAADGSGASAPAPSTVLINLGGGDAAGAEGQTVVIQSPGSDPAAADASTLVLDAGPGGGSGDGPAILVVDLTTGAASSSPDAATPNVLVIDSGQGDAAQSSAVSNLLTRHATELAQSGGGLEAVSGGMLDLLQGGVLDGTGRTADAPLVLVLTDAGTDPATVKVATDGAGLTAGQLGALKQHQSVPEDQLHITVHTTRGHVEYRLSYQIQLGRPFETEQVRVDMQFANRNLPAGRADPRQPAIRRRLLGLRMRGSAAKRTQRARVPGRATTEGRNTTGQAETTVRASNSHGSGGGDGGYDHPADSSPAPATVDLPAATPGTESVTQFGA